MKYVVVTRIYVEASSPEKAKDMVSYELGHKIPFMNYPYTEGICQYDCDCEEVLTIEDFAKKASEK